MKRILLTSLLLPLLFCAACTSFRVSGEVQRGRMKLLEGEPKAALANFQRAAELDPNYVTDFTPLEQGVWTYVGRAYYETGNLPAARKTLQRARSENSDDYLAGLYLGLALARNGDRDRGVKEIASGMKGIHDWLDHIEYSTLYGQFWDPGKKIRSTIQTDLAMISGKDIDWKRLIGSAEWVGKRMEEEIDLARRDERQELLQDGDDGGEEP